MLIPKSTTAKHDIPPYVCIPDNSHETNSQTQSQCNHFKPIKTTYQTSTMSSTTKLFVLILATAEYVF